MAKKKCSFCNHKLGLITFTCSCGGTFCVKHQTKHSHNCSEETKVEKQKKIEKNNPKVIPKKVESC